MITGDKKREYRCITLTNRGNRAKLFSRESKYTQPREYDYVEFYGGAQTCSRNQPWFRVQFKRTFVLRGGVHESYDTVHGKLLIDFEEDKWCIELGKVVERQPLPLAERNT